MPQGFTYSTKHPKTGEEEVRALCGPKGLCYPSRAAWDEIVHRSNPLADGRSSATDREAAVDRLIESAINAGRSNPFELPLHEEIDHFRCITHSRVCSVLLWANPFVRWAHAEAAQSISFRPDRRIARMVFRYHVVTAEYFWRAEPLIEAAFLNRIRGMHPERLKTASARQLQQLQEWDQTGRAAPLHHAAIGRETDWLFVGRKSGGAWEEVRLRIQIARRFRWLLGGLDAGHWLAAWRMKQVVWRLGLNWWHRLHRKDAVTKPPDGESAGLGRRPFIWAPHIWADPLVHAAGSAILPGADAEHGLREKFLADMWWFVLRICGDAHALAKEGVSRAHIRFLEVRDAAFWVRICQATHAGQDFTAAAEFMINWTNRIVGRTLAAKNCREEEIMEIALQVFRQMRRSLAEAEAAHAREEPPTSALAYSRLFDIPYIQV